MSRARMQVLIIPFTQEGDAAKYCILRRSDMLFWQFIAGGGEAGETPLEAAKRETWEETGIKENTFFYPLESTCSIPTENFSTKSRKEWGVDCLVIPEYSFAARVKTTDIVLSAEHSEYRWVDYIPAIQLLKFDSNKTALWELDQKIKQKRI